MHDFNLTLDNLNYTLREFKIKQRDMAEEMGCHPQQVSSWVSGRRAPSKSTQNRLIIAAKRLIRAKLVYEIDLTEEKLHRLYGILEVLEEAEES